jgi:hypothetical protein
VMRRKVAEKLDDPEWEVMARCPMSSLWTDRGRVDGWHYWEDSFGRIYRNQGRVWQLKVQEVVQ